MLDDVLLWPYIRFVRVIHSAFGSLVDIPYNLEASINHRLIPSAFSEMGLANKGLSVVGKLVPVAQLERILEIIEKRSRIRNKINNDKK